MRDTVEALIAVVYLCWGAFLLVWLGGYLYNLFRAPRSVSVRSGVGAGGWLSRALVVLAVVVALTHRENVTGLLRVTAISDPTVGVIGSVILIASTAFTIWARFSLGTMWSSQPMIKEQHRLRTEGPYHITRHPIYTGMLGMFGGATLITGSALVLIGLLIFGLYIAMKIQTEERLLVETFGDEYRRYRETVPAVIPFSARH